MRRIIFWSGRGSGNKWVGVRDVEVGGSKAAGGQECKAHTGAQEPKLAGAQSGVAGEQWHRVHLAPSTGGAGVYLAPSYGAP